MLTTIKNMASPLEKDWVQRYIASMPDRYVWVVSGVAGSGKSRLLVEAATSLSKGGLSVALVDTMGDASWDRWQGAGGAMVRTQSVVEAIRWTEAIRPNVVVIDGLLNLDEAPEIAFLKLEQMAVRTGVVIACSTGSLRTRQGQISHRLQPIVHRASMIFEPESVGIDYVELAILKCRHLNLPFPHRIRAGITPLDRPHLRLVK